MMTVTQDAIHATCVAINGAGIMITGKSGSGKSDLALRLIDRGCLLVSDDHVLADKVLLDSGDEGIMLHAVEEIAGQLEIRSLGIHDFDYITAVPLKMMVELTDRPERYPMDQQMRTILGLAIPVIKLNPFEASAPIKVEIALKALIDKATGLNKATGLDNETGLDKGTSVAGGTAQ